MKKLKEIQKGKKNRKKNKKNKNLEEINKVIIKEKEEIKNSDLKDEEILNLEKEIELINLEDYNYIDTKQDNSDITIEETLEDIKEDFMEIKEEKDCMSSKEHEINPTLNIYENFNSSLNSKSNPFIKASKNIKKTNKYLNVSQTDSEIESTNNETKHKENPKNIENDYIKENENTKKNKFNGKPSRNRVLEESKEINLNSIKVNEDDLIGDKQSDNYWYRKFKLYGKNYILMTKSKTAKKQDYVIYYCHFHNTTIDSTITTKSVQRQNKKMLLKNFLL
jgi:hypothetical protein